METLTLNNKILEEMETTEEMEEIMAVMEETVITKTTTTTYLTDTKSQLYLNKLIN